MKWRERVAAWRTSGKTAEAFAKEGDFEATTLRYWASRLKSRKAPASPTSDTPNRVPMARVVRRRSRSTEAGQRRDEGTALVIAVGEARIVIGRDFDPALLRDVVAALGGKK